MLVHARVSFALKFPLTGTQCILIKIWMDYTSRSAIEGQVLATSFRKNEHNLGRAGMWEVWIKGDVQE